MIVIPISVKMDCVIGEGSLVSKVSLSEHQAKLLDLLEEQLCLWDQYLYDGVIFDAELYFRKVHRAVDAVYRELEGIPQPTKTGRPRKFFCQEK